MAEKNIKTSSVGEPRVSGETPETSNDFQETLLKSGLDISAFRAAEPAENNLPAEKKAVVFPVNLTKAENKIVKSRAARHILESPEADGKVSPKSGRWRHLTAIGGIAAIIVLQSVFQFSFIQDKNQRLAENSAENISPAEQKIEENIVAETPRTEVAAIEQKPRAAEKTIYKKTDAKVLIQPKKSAAKIQNEIRESPAKTTFRKKEQRESTAARLRRAEKILTGV